VLLANGADVNQCDVKGTAALQVAAVHGHVRFTELLLAAVTLITMETLVYMWLQSHCTSAAATKTWCSSSDE
jgi:ankyrin repeat protein